MCGYEIMINCLIDIHRSWSRSRFIFEGPEPEPPKIGRLRNSALNIKKNIKNE